MPVDEEIEDQAEPGADSESSEQPDTNPDTTDGKDVAPDLSNLSDARIAQLKKVCDAFDQRDQWARLIEIIRCTLRRYFYIGIQHPYWNSDAGQFQVGPSGAQLAGEEMNEEEFFEEEFNIFTANVKIFQAVFSQTAAPSRMEPDKPMDGKSVEAAAEAEKYIEVYQKYNPPKVAQLEVGRLMQTDGRIIAVTEYETDEEKCGVDDEGNPQGAEFTRYKGVLESKVPIVGEFKRWPYCKLSTEIDITVAKDENPKYASKLEGNAKGQTPNNEVARMSRIAVDEGIAQVSADTLAYLVTEDCWWFRRSAFRVLDKEEQVFWLGTSATDTESGQPGLVTKGLRTKFIGSVFCGGKLISMDEQIKCMHAMSGTGNARPSLSDAMVPIQMEFNDAIGMFSQLLHECIPGILVDTTAESLAALTEQRSEWGQYHAFQSQNGRPISENVFPEPQLQMPVGFAEWIQNLQGPLSQFITGNQPSLFGGDMEDQKTAAAYAQARDMSLGLMSIVWVPYLEFAAGIRWQAARLAAKRDQDKISAVLPEKEDKTKVVDIDVSVLGRGGFICSPVTDQNFPESFTAKANKLMGLFAAAPTNPIAMQIFQEPDNLVALKDASGLELVIKGAAARDKQLAEWELMQSEDGPIPDMQATQEKDQQAQQAVDVIAPGTQAPPVPPVMTSSVPILLADDHIEEARTCVRILNDSATLKMRATQPDVVKDLELHLVAHLTKAQGSGIVIPPDLLGIIPPPPMPPMPPPGAGGPPGAPKPHPAKPPAASAAQPGAQPEPAPLVPLVPLVPPTGGPNVATA